MKKSQSKLTDAEILRQKAEEQLALRKDLAHNISVTEEDTLKIVHELQVHQIELEMQSEQLIEDKENADAAAQKYTELYDFAPSGYITLSKEGRIIGLNLKGADMLGKERQRLINCRFDLFVSVGTRQFFNEFLSKVFKGKLNEWCEVMLSDESKNISTYVHLDGHVLENDEQCIISAVDISALKLGEQKMIESEEKYRVLIESTSVAIYLTDSNGKCTYVNPKWCELAHLSFSEALNDGWVNGIYEEDRNKVFKNWQKMIALGGNWGFEYRFGPPDKLSWVFGTAKSYQNHSGQILGFIGSNVDITERKRAEEVLYKSHAMLDATFDSLTDAIFILDDQAVVVECNRAVSRIFGYRQDEIQGQTTEFLHVDKSALEEFRQHLYTPTENEGRLDLFELRMKRMDGTIFATENSVLPLVNVQGRRSGWVSVVRDITERKIAEEKQKEIEERYHLLAEQSDAGVGLYSPDGIIIYFNNKALKNLGGNIEDFVGKSLTDVFGKKEGTKYFKRVREGIRLNKTLVYEDQFESPTGKYWFSTSNSLFRNSKGEVIGIQAVSIDITHSKENEVQLMKSTNELRELTRHLLDVKEEERAIIARDLHDDLGQKLTAINMDIAWLKSRIGVQSRTVEKKFVQMQQVMNDTIDSVQKISYGLRPSILDDLGLRSAIEWQLKEFYKLSGIKVKSDFVLKDEIINSHISLAIFRIVQEALTNVLRHSHATSVVIKVSAYREKLNVFIKDNGNGIESEKIESIKSFGLIGMRERVKSNNGEIKISGKKGIGTEIFVKIPFKV